MKEKIGLVVSFSIVLFTVCFQLVILREYIRYKEICEEEQIPIEQVRELKISDKLLTELIEESKKGEIDLAHEITIRMMVYDYNLSDVNTVKAIPFGKAYINKLCNLDTYEQLYDIYDTIFTDLTYFPVPEDVRGGETISFSDSWGGARTYGGDRKHEGTDIMTSNNLRGYFPVLSISDGVVEKKGWLEKGGYRVGIRSNNGCYFYYAHLDSYALDLEVGDQVKAGEMIGYMGDTGYSKVEGTTGNFPVHLHLGIYIFDEKIETSFNPYWILRYLVEHKLEYSF